MTRTSFYVDLEKYVGPEARDKNFTNLAKMIQVRVFFVVVAELLLLFCFVSLIYLERFGTDSYIFPWRRGTIYIFQSTDHNC